MQHRPATPGTPCDPFAGTPNLYVRRYLGSFCCGLRRTCPSPARAGRHVRVRVHVHVGRGLVHACVRARTCALRSPPLARQTRLALFAAACRSISLPPRACRLPYMRHPPPRAPPQIVPDVRTRLLDMFYGVYRKDSDAVIRWVMGAARPSTLRCAARPSLRLGDAYCPQAPRQAAGGGRACRRRAAFLSPSWCRR